MSIQLSPVAWQLQAACRGPQSEVFFPPSQSERKHDRLERERRAKAICGICPVRSDCLSYAMEIRESHGIWGGLSESERKSMMERQLAAS
ncbi:MULTISPECIES: WhiB family transcriptional regulator [Candidatus Neomicrothrix]|uniref:Transcriptional regulator WhiB n=1 Tax=Candidatus Neomicrothrix parvicella RN1 TaxID=1229780 RepID=R4YWD0_9ACTN|nr:MULTISPECIES: WhiB family transcriptional regulator [Microthrix]NLH65819.1 WhiB family transcriptional regulator [Candidatus Microthrix parvicella]MBK6504004.1 WhiB family transcriptional regulator [Candidatus Microthrix sp.]MBK7019288.1 WhiB family transcriptional regulator [Candidatus Microthrix sp.]MBK7320954.1 WhiB family transcriptional regulator [Candidatus Microthrix sp.]MBL0204258.1 WhiB family transcriptional regulator [Candidatus Microthrix sp.]